uniref:Uncharacterized protein n=1 Tax=Schistocephalus solidus TaxID=70667 RepID=A0A0X3NYW5_SCHSO
MLSRRNVPQYKCLPSSGIKGRISVSFYQPIRSFGKGKTFFSVELKLINLGWILFLHIILYCPFMGFGHCVMGIDARCSEVSMSDAISHHRNPPSFRAYFIARKTASM